MRIPVAIFAILVVLCAVVLVLWTIDERPDSRGADHPVHETMRQGGSSERHDAVLPWGFLYGLLSIVLFVAVMALGLRRRGRLPAGSRRALWSGLALYALTFMLLVLSYRGYVEPGADHALFGSFPRPSAWMLYGIWPVPLLFALLYMWNFDRWVISEDEVAEFERLAAESKRQRGRDDAEGEG
ncbi:MAG: hypothetical protein F4Y16_08775 [Holophagales bacterium]|nr:hypothetical protein [Holophagales bacterium]MYH25202.1 hypothetical protein [Holophagales bacterium]